MALADNDMLHLDVIAEPAGAGHAVDRPVPPWRLGGAVASSESAMAEHGYSTKYNAGCRCDTCITGARLRMSDYRRSKGISPRPVARHGTGAKYAAGCRCEPCTEANRSHARDYKRRRYGASALKRRRA